MWVSAHSLPPNPQAALLQKSCSAPISFSPPRISKDFLPSPSERKLGAFKPITFISIVLSLLLPMSYHLITVLFFLCKILWLTILPNQIISLPLLQILFFTEGLAILGSKKMEVSLCLYSFANKFYHRGSLYTYYHLC